MLKKVSKKTLASLQLFRSCSVIFPEEAEALDAALRARPERVCVQRQAFKNVAQCVLTRATWNTDTGGSRLRSLGGAVGGGSGGWGRWPGGRGRVLGSCVLPLSKWTGHREEQQLWPPGGSAHTTETLHGRPPGPQNPTVTARPGLQHLRRSAD